MQCWPLCTLLLATLCEPAQGLTLLHQHGAAYMRDPGNLNVSQILRLYNSTSGDQEFYRLEAGTAKDAKPRDGLGNENVFDGVHISCPLMPPLLDHDPRVGNGQGRKNILTGIRGGGRKCIVYAVGIADDSGFEERMPKMVARCMRSIARTTSAPRA
mmetsp:Transcript_81787/g.215756  ORF Transcript_81787/g.215756 Transcript_81787/m.215756 type:complete len:157 (-) Transcript_81787:140-610(-)